MQEISEVTPQKFYAEPKADSFTKFVALLLDTILLLVTHCLTCLAGYFIYTNIDSYKNGKEAMVSEARECYGMQEESHLYHYSGTGVERFDKPVNQKENYTTWCASHIIRSFNFDNSYFVEKGITALAFDEKIKEASFEVDDLAYFFNTFVRNKNDEYGIMDLDGKDPLFYYFKLFDTYAYKDGTNNIWIYDTSVNKLPILKGSYAFDLYKYIKIDADYESGKKLFNNVGDSFMNIWDEEYDILISSTKFDLHLQEYRQKYHDLSIWPNLCTVFSYIVAFLIAYLLPTLLSKNKQTLGKKIQKIMIVSKNDDDATTWQIILRSICKLFSLFGIATISCVLCCGTDSSWTEPLFKMGSFGVSVFTFNLLFLIVGLASFIVSLFNKDRRNLADLICKTRVIDLKYHVNDNLVLPDEQKSEEKEQPLKTETKEDNELIDNLINEVVNDNDECNKDK